MPSQTFYYALVPDTGGRPTPAWGVATRLQFMANNSISYAVLSISTPGSNVFLGGGGQALAVGLKRLLNEWLAEVSEYFGTSHLFYRFIKMYGDQSKYRFRTF